MGARKRVSIWALILVGGIPFLAGVSQLGAHSDPRGEVHPEVSVDGEQFVVTSYDNRFSGTKTMQTTTRVLDRRGHLLATKNQAVPETPFSSTSFPQLPEDWQGIERPYGGGWLVFPEYFGKHGGVPFAVSVQGERVVKVPLEWSVTHAVGVTGVEDVVLTKTGLFLLVSRDSGTSGMELWLHQFSLANFREQAAVSLPKPVIIYSPVRSNLISYGGSVFVAFVHEKEFFFGGYELLLVGWDGVAPTPTIKSLTRKIDWNTSVSLGHVGPHALVAYHYPGRYPRFSWTTVKPAGIRWIPVDLDAL